MNNEQQLLYKVIKNFVGMQKIDVFDILHRIEILLFDAKNPINYKDLKHIITTHINNDLDKINSLQFTVLPNGNFCEFVGSNDWLYIYKEQRKGIVNRFFNHYYFKTKHSPLRLTKLNKKNLLDNVRNTTNEVIINKFLEKNKITRRDVISGQLLLLTY